MDQQRWKKIKDIFNAALEVPVSERDGFVRIASGGDCELESEILRLLMADEHAGSYLQSPLIPGGVLGTLGSPSLIQAGDILCQRFRIDRLIGEGGMGHVFEAWDGVLRVRVALKAIRPEIAGHPASLSRFRQEVLAARSISHLNVCRTFDIELETKVVNSVTGASQNIVFLTMEFLEGETLAERIARTGPLPKEEAIAIAWQIASALSCAHDHGIVHGDIKPANVMLVRRGGSVYDSKHAPSTDLRVVITDFGLARIDPLFSRHGFSSATGSILPGGTLAYMAPEQLEGTAISTATDIYAFGLVLVEMVTGQRAFSSSNLLAGIAQRLMQPVALPRTLISALPASWCNAIEGCLRAKPSERFKNATDVISVLKGTRTRFPQVNRTLLSRWFAVLERPLWWLSAVLGLLAIVVALFVGSLRLYQSRAESRVAPGALVYLPAVKNRTGEKPFDNLTVLIQVGIAQSAQVNLLGQGQAGDILQQMKRAPAITMDAPTARQIAMRAGAARVIFVTVAGSGGNYSLDVDIQQPDSASPDRYREHWTRSFAWHGSNMGSSPGNIPADLLTAIRKASDWIRHEAGESSNDIARLNLPPEGVTTISWAALEDYAEGERLTAANQRENAVIVLEHAVKNDPDFALAWGRMGDILLSLHRDEEGYKAYDRALDAAQQSRLTRKEEDRIRGMRAVDSADYQLAVDAFHDYTVYYPHDSIGWIYPMFPLRMLGRDDEAISGLRRALELDPSGAFANYGLAQELILLGQTEEAHRWASTHLHSQYPELADRIEATLLLLNGQYDQAEKLTVATQVTAGPMNRSYGYKVQASLAADRGDYRQAIEYLNRGLDEDKQENRAERFSKLLDRAYLEARLGEFDNCLRDIHAGLDASTSPWTIVTADTVLGAAYLASPPRYHGPIRRELARIDRMLVASNGRGAIFEFAKLRTQGEILLAEGRLRAAMEAFRKAALKDAPAESREYLGRALWALATSEKNSGASDSLRQALDAYSVTALRPALIWCSAGSYLPGFYADQLQSYVQIAQALGNKDTQAAAAKEKLAGLRNRPNIRGQFSGLSNQ